MLLTIKLKWKNLEELSKLCGVHFPLIASGYMFIAFYLPEDFYWNLYEYMDVLCVKFKTWSAKCSFGFSTQTF